MGPSWKHSHEWPHWQKQYQQGINQMMKELGQQYGRACVCVQLNACVYLYPYWCCVGMGKMQLALRRCSRQGRLCLEIPVYMCQHNKCVVCERVKTRWAISASAVSVPCDLLWSWLPFPSQPAYCNQPCVVRDSGYGSAHPTWTLWLLHRSFAASLHRWHFTLGLLKQLCRIRPHCPG